MTREIMAADGVRISAHEHGDPTQPTVLAIHGYPDDHSLWNDVVETLAGHYHVVTYDVRGAGTSDVPHRREDYALHQLESDLATVADAVSPHQKVHLLGHDWGSIQAWHAVTGDRMRDRIASFTSISGPCLDHAARWFRDRLRRPTPRNLKKLALQTLASGYIGFFQLPKIPELAWRARIVPHIMSTVERFDLAGQNSPAPKVSNGIPGLALYRRNMPEHLRRPQKRHTDVPVQILAPTGDPFVSAPMQTDIARWCSDLYVRRVPGGHWLPRTHPQLVARCARELVDNVERSVQSRGLRRGHCGRDRGRFADQLVVVTGAGSGIGRETALAFAEQGAEVVATDVDPRAVARTAELASLLGPAAAHHVVDVSDGEAVREFAEKLEAERGVPDVVVNNAGIGVAGSFTDTTEQDWQRIIDVNLWGVIHGCRAFADRMVARGEGGRIVNVASLAAYLPSRSLSAYSTTKSAVLTLSQCLRAELAASGIGVTAVCPGFVHTNITSRTRFAGTGEAEQQRHRTAATKLYRRRNFTPGRAAADILRAVETNPAVQPITAEAKAGLVLSRLTPGLLRAAARADLTPG